jgi:tetratricopeptide (TPR) repeat protein
VDGRFTECWRCDVERGSVEEKAGAQPVARTRRPNPLTVVALLGITGAVLFVLTHAPSRESRAASHNSQGLVHYNKSRFDDAIREYTRALELRTDDHDLLWNRACARWGKGDYDGFIADTSRILQERGDANLYLWRALAFERSQRYPAMREDATMALQRKPGFVDAYLCRGRARWFLGDVEGAAKDLDSAVAADPKCAEGWGTRGGLHEATGNLDSALADLQRALECNRQMGYAACG